ncbi:MAG: molybdopterin molybdotransferase MoeA [Deltaproteobacteria bacterium]|jgi:molybdopterin molybdotransferase|nr:molybdopterin molybdotransferase MoeA [Deltaproteobacteria bacterium]
MISIQEALRILQENLPDPKIDTVDLTDAFGRYLAEPVVAPEGSPRYTNSAMDGYALRWADVMAASPENPMKLKVIGESMAGMPYDSEVGCNEAVRISTGAMLPMGTDTVVRVEDTAAPSDTEVEILAVRSQGQDVRHEGEEFRCGDELFQPCTKLTARQLALLATVGQEQVKVFASPRVSILITGSELASSEDRDIRSFQIRDSNSIMLKTALQEAGAEVHSCVNVEDELQATVEALSRAAALEDDFIICSGGVSVGNHDHVKEAAGEIGFSELFWRIRQKPGKPLFVARKGKAFLFGLPGNPVSAFMCFAHYIRPLLFTIRGRGMTWRTITAMAGGEIANRGSRTNFIRVKLEQKPGRLPQIIDVKKQGSHMLSSIVNADGYIIVEPGVAVAPGEAVNVYLF